MLYVGWKSIAGACGVTVKTARKWAKKYGMPIKHIGARVTIIPQALEEWHDSIIEPTARDKPGYVYFLEASSCHLIKIGFSHELKKRLKALCSESPVEIKFLGCISGTRTEEKQIHRLLKKYHSHGEWFYLNQEILEFIKANKINNVEEGPKLPHK